MDNLHLDSTSDTLYTDILITLLENFLILSLEPARLDTSAATQDYAVKLLQRAIEPLAAEVLPTGSVAENVCSVFIRSSEFNVPILYSPEMDTMAVISIKDLIGPSLTHLLQPTANGNECFTKIQLLKVNESEQQDSNTEYKGGILLMYSQYENQGYHYLSPLRFINHCRERMELSSIYVETPVSHLQCF